MKWLYNNWHKATLALAVITTTSLLVFDVEKNTAVFLIWLQTVVYFLHQFEEYILPGGFIAFFNTKVLGSQQSDIPLDKKAAFWINVPIIFIAFPISAYFASSITIGIGLWTAYFSVINALSHVGMAFRFKYNPGLVVSLLLNIPVGLYAIYYLTTNNLVSLKENILGLGIGLAVQLSLMVYGFLILKPRIKESS